ncbi:hypothetical protein [Pseudomonas mandelii]|uniref:Uncharacterized protein n=1 Tax=Pseudomonas mandelii TaxID=75612 RepID=A0A502IDX5_9PSED|nr:hypothetical protein [Pseudomonas mandelii]TPG85121.1 hypothetical protein EAH74_07450 [Pseudomonas mandelii]
MTAHTETIARLTGKLVFDVNTGPLQQAMAVMQAASQKMLQLGKEVDKLTAKMAKPLKLKIDTSDADKAKTKLSHAIGREAKAQKALSDAKRQTFQAELQSKKWIYSVDKQHSNLVSQSVKDQQHAAVIAAKTFAAQQAANGVSKQQVASQGSLVTLQAKQARLQQILAKTQATTAKADANHLLTQSKANQIQIVAQRIAQKTQHDAILHQARVASLAAAANAKQTAHNNAQTKFQWQGQKHAVWQANQAARAAKAANASNSGGGFGGGGIGSMLHGGIGGIGLNIAEALGPVGVAVAALTAAMYVLRDRVEKRQESTSDTQQFDNALAAASEDPTTRKKFNDAYVNDYQEFGMSINKDSARTYSNSVAGLGKMGYSPDAAMKVMKDRSALFRAGNLNATQQESLNYQMGQVLAKGYASGTDYKPIEDALGPRLAGDVDIGAARQLGYRGKDKGAKAYMLQARTERRITPQSLDAGFAYAVSQNQEPLERHKNSIEARQARYVNDQYLQTAKQQADPALVGAIGERIDAERKLVEAMAPANKMFEELDKSLTNFDTGLINLTAKLFNMSAGKNVDGSEKTDQEKTQDRMTTADMPVSLGMVGTHDYSNVDGNSQHQGGPVGNFWNWALGIKDKREEYKKQAMDLAPDTLGQAGAMPGITPQFQFGADTIKQMAGFYNRSSNSPAFDSVNSTNTANSMAAPQINTTIEGSNINIELHGSATDEDRTKIMDAITVEMDKRTDAMALKMPEIAERSFRNALGQARSLQYDGQ